MYGIKGWSYVVLHAMVVSHSAGLSIKQFSCEDVEVFVQQHAAAVTGPPNSSHMLFFLHLPRTAGRTYHSCFLKTATPPSRRCEKSYDVLRLNASIPSCGLLSSHDDMSISKNLPEDTAYITQLRSAFLNCLSTCTVFRAAAVSSSRLRIPGRYADLQSTASHMPPDSCLEVVQSGTFVEMPAALDIDWYQCGAGTLWIGF